MRTRLVILGAVLVTLGGCSSGSNSGEPVATEPAGAPVTTAADDGQDGLPDPCSLLTRDEVNAATGRTFGEGVINAAVSHDGMAACDWALGVDTVQVLISSVNAFDDNKKIAVDVYGPADELTVPGAARAYAAKGGFLIGMDMGEEYLQVSFIATNPSQVSSAVRDLAGKAAGRMP